MYIYYVYVYLAVLYEEILDLEGWYAVITLNVMFECPTNIPSLA